MKDAIWTLKAIAWYTVQSGYITVGELAKETNCSESTARRRIKELLKMRVVMWRNRGEYALDNRNDVAFALEQMYMPVAGMAGTELDRGQALGYGQ